MQIGMDQTAEWILLWYGEIDWREYFGMKFAYPHPRGLAQYWRNHEPTAWESEINANYY